MVTTIIINLHFIYLIHFYLLGGKICGWYCLEHLNRKLPVLIISSNLDAVVVIASTASKILWSAVSAPIVMSVPQKSLSIEPTCIRIKFEL